MLRLLFEAHTVQNFNLKEFDAASDARGAATLVAAGDSALPSNCEGCIVSGGGAGGGGGGGGGVGAARFARRASRGSVDMV